jgi:hypothetical protein
MGGTEAPTWWADVQQDREQIGERAVDSWIDEEVIDFTPRRRFVHAESAPAAQRATDGVAAPLSPPPVEGRRTVTITGRPTAVERPRRVTEDAPGPRRQLKPVSHRLGHLGHRPDRIALWAAFLGFFLILVAATSSSEASAAVISGI